MCLRNRASFHRRRLALALCVFSAASILMAVPAAMQEKAQHQNLEARKLKNPVPSDSDSIEAGKKLYQRNCASCHGPGAKGDGGMSLSGGTPPDLTDEKWDYGSTDGEIFVVIRDGVSADMQGYKDKLSEKQIWHVINFIRSLGPKAN